MKRKSGTFVKTAKIFLLNLDLMENSDRKNTKTKTTQLDCALIVVD